MIKRPENDDATKLMYYDARLKLLGLGVDDPKRNRLIESLCTDHDIVVEQYELRLVMNVDKLAEFVNSLEEEKGQRLTVNKAFSVMANKSLPKGMQKAFRFEHDLFTLGETNYVVMRFPAYSEAQLEAKKVLSDLSAELGGGVYARAYGLDMALDKYIESDMKFECRSAVIDAATPECKKSLVASFSSGQEEPSMVSLGMFVSDVEKGFLNLKASFDKFAAKQQAIRYQESALTGEF
ncbi:hypothetical protein AB4254_09080 [Vibrio breoganii]